MLKKTVILLSVFSLSLPAFASRQLTNDEVLNILQTLTASPMKTWIPAGTIEATHTEYRAPKTTDPDVINTRISRDLLVAAAENATAMRVLDDASVRQSRQRIYRMQVEAMPHNVRYNLSNESTMQSSVIIKYDGDRFYWEINVASRSDSITPPADLVSNGHARRFDLNWNQQRVFVWDGASYIHYFRPGNHAIVTHERGNVNGPLTAGIVPWGYGVYTYENLSTLPLSGVEMESNGQVEIQLTVTDPEWQDVLILDPAKNYALKSRTRTIGNFVTAYTYSNHTLVGGRWCPAYILIEKYEVTDGGSILLSGDAWNITSVTDQAPPLEDFSIGYELDALIEDYPTDGDRLIYRYAPPMPPEAKNVDTNQILAERLAIARKENEKYRNCATVALQHVANRLGAPVTLSEAARMLGPRDSPVSFAALQKTAEQLGLYTLPVKTDIKTLADKGDAEAILHLPKNDHYVVLGNIDDQYVRLIDLSSKNFHYRRTINTFEKLWDGTTMLLDNKPIPPAPRLAKLNHSFLNIICGAADCMDCNDVIQNASNTSCAQTQGCGTFAVVQYKRMGCTTAEPGTSCSETSMVFSEEARCSYAQDPNDPSACADDGNWTSSSDQACE